MTDELDYDEFEETLAGLRDYLRADDIFSVAKDSPEEMREYVAALLGLVRHTAESVNRAALVLRRIPESRESMAEHLEELAAMLIDAVGERESAI